EPLRGASVVVARLRPSAVPRRFRRLRGRGLRDVLALGSGRGLPQSGQALQAGAFEHLAQCLGSDLRVAAGFRGRRRTVDGAGRGRFLDRHLGGGGVFETLVAHGSLMSVGPCGSAMSAVPVSASKSKTRRPETKTVSARESRSSGSVDQMTISASRPTAKE